MQVLQFHTNATTVFNQIIAAIDSPGAHADGWYKGQCPNAVAHKGGDNNPSFNVKLNGDGKIIVKCFAGCGTATIWDALKLRGIERPTKRGDATEYQYFYKGEHIRSEFKPPKPDKPWQGLPDGIVETVRGLGFDEWSPTPDPDGKLKPRMLPDLLKNTPYNHDALHEANYDELIIITEGAKDAQRLIELGYLATTNTCGGATWNAHNTNHLPKYKKYVLFTDRDKTGADRVVKISASLRRAGLSHRVARFFGSREGGDISDELDGAATPADAKEIVDTAIDESMSFDKWRATPEAVDFLGKTADTKEKEAAPVAPSPSRPLIDIISRVVFDGSSSDAEVPDVFHIRLAGKKEALVANGVQSKLSAVQSLLDNVGVNYHPSDLTEACRSIFAKIDREALPTEEATLPLIQRTLCTTELLRAQPILCNMISSVAAKYVAYYECSYFVFNMKRHTWDRCISDERIQDLMEPLFGYGSDRQIQMKAVADIKKKARRNLSPKDTLRAFSEKGERAIVYDLRTGKRRAGGIEDFIIHCTEGRLPESTQGIGPVLQTLTTEWIRGAEGEDSSEAHVEEVRAWFLFVTAMLVIGNSGHRRMWIAAIGESGTGKSLYSDVVRHLMPQESTREIVLDAADNRFALGMCGGRSVLFGRDIVERQTKNIQAMLKRITGESTLLIERKRMDDCEIENRFRLLTTSNFVPYFQDDPGLTKRLVPIAFSKPLDDNPQSTDDIISSMEGERMQNVLALLEIAHMLYSGKVSHTFIRDSMPKSSRKLKERVASRNNPIVEWLHDEGEGWLARQDTVTTKQLANKVNEWSGLLNSDKGFTSRSMGQKAKRLMEGAGFQNPGGKVDGTQRGWIRKSPAPIEKVYESRTADETYAILRITAPHPDTENADDQGTTSTYLPPNTGSDIYAGSLDGSEGLSGSSANHNPDPYA